MYEMKNLVRYIETADGKEWTVEERRLCNGIINRTVQPW